MSKTELNEKGELYHHNFMTKLRCDGDGGLNHRSDYRLAFSEALLAGTKHFSPKAVQNCVDEIRFVGKSEIGRFGDEDPRRIASHAGSDIVDFAAYYVGRELLRDAIIASYQKSGLTRSQAVMKMNSTVTLHVAGKAIRPFDTLVKKVICKDNFRSCQLLDDSGYWTIA